MMLHYEAIPQHHKLNCQSHHTVNFKKQKNENVKQIYNFIIHETPKVLSHHDNSAVMICRITLNWLPMMVSMLSDVDNIKLSSS